MVDLVVDDGEVVVLLWARPATGVGCVTNSSSITGSLSGGIALKTSPGSLKNSGSRRGCRADGVTVRRPALFRNPTTLDWFKTHGSSDSLRLNLRLREERHHEHQADDGKKSFHTSRFSSQQQTTRLWTFSLDSIFWRIAVPILGPSNARELDRSWSPSCLPNSISISHLVICRVKTSRSHCTPTKARVGKQSRDSQVIFGLSALRPPKGSSPVRPIASFSSSSKPPENVFQNSLTWEQDPSPLPGLPPVRPPIPVLCAKCLPAKLAVERSLSTPCLHHPMTRNTDGGRAAARYHQT